MNKVLLIVVMIGLFFAGHINATKKPPPSPVLKYLLRDQRWTHNQICLNQSQVNVLYRVNSPHLESESSFGVALHLKHPW